MFRVCAVMQCPSQEVHHQWRISMAVTLMLFLLRQASELQQNPSMETPTFQRLGEYLFGEVCHERHARELKR